MTKDKTDSVILDGKGPSIRIEHKFHWKEFFTVDWKDRWNVILLILAIIILYLSIRAIIHALSVTATP